MESMLNKLKSTVTKVTADVTSAVMGNPVTREFEVGRHIASGGPGMSWRIYNGTKKSTKQVSRSSTHTTTTMSTGPVFIKRTFFFTSALTKNRRH